LVSLTNANITGVILNRGEELPDLYAHFKLLPSIYLGMATEDAVNKKRERRLARNKKQSDRQDYAIENNPIDIFWSNQDKNCITFESRNDSKNADQSQKDEDVCSIALGPMSVASSKKQS
jgi:hypothetical protein